jgi:tetratricopeptide (TPR) repeat protein
MDRGIFAAIPFVLACHLVGAGTFEGLEPGVSSKSDVDRVLGPPVREVAAGVRYDYNPAAYDARRISVEFAVQTGVVSSIDLYLAQQYSRSDYQSWFELGQPTVTAYDDSGNRVESYAVAGISLHFDGPGENDPVRFFRHYDMLAAQAVPSRPTSPQPSDPPARATNRHGWSAEQYVARAERAEKEDDWATLRTIVEEGLRIYPDQACLWNLRGSFFYNDGGGAPPEVRRNEMLRSALRAYHLVADYDHTVDLAWAYYRVLDDCSSANYYLEQIEEEATAKHSFLVYVMGTCYERNGDIETAIRYYHEYLRREPDTEQAAKVRDRLYVLDR